MRVSTSAYLRLHAVEGLLLGLGELQLAATRHHLIGARGVAVTRRRPHGVASMASVAGWRSVRSDLSDYLAFFPLLAAPHSSRAIKHHRNDTM